MELWDVATPKPALTLRGHKINIAPWPSPGTREQIERDRRSEPVTGTPPPPNPPPLPPTCDSSWAPR